MFRGRREQQLNFACADVGPQGPAESAATTGPGYAAGIGKLVFPEPTKPGTSPWAFSVDYQLATGA